MLKRILSSLVLIPLVTEILVFGNKYLVDIALSIITIMSLYEFYNSFPDAKEKKEIHIIGYVAAVLIAFIHIFCAFSILYISSDLAKSRLKSYAYNLSNL